MSQENTIMPDSEINYADLLPETHRFFNLLRGTYNPEWHANYPASWLASVYFSHMDAHQIVDVMQELRTVYLDIEVIPTGSLSADNFVEDALEALMMPILIGFGVYETVSGQFKMKDIQRLEVIERIIALEAANRFDESNSLLEAEYTSPEEPTRLDFDPAVRIETPSAYSASASHVEAYTDVGKTWLKFVKPTGKVAMVIGLNALQMTTLAGFLENVSLHAE